MADVQRIGLDEIIPHFEALEDPRSTVNRQHPLVSVVIIALMAVLAGANGPTAIAKWAALKAEFLRSALPLPNGIPRKDVFRRVLMTLKPPPAAGMISAPNDHPGVTRYSGWALASFEARTQTVVTASRTADRRLKIRYIEVSSIGPAWFPVAAHPGRPKPQRPW